MTELSDIYTETLGIKKTLLVEKRRKEMWRTDKTIPGEKKKKTILYKNYETFRAVLPQKH